MHNGAIMSSEVRHLVDDARPYPLVRLSGVLDATTVGSVRDVLLDVLAGQPEAVVVDAGGLELGEATAAGVMREVRRETTFWPARSLRSVTSAWGAGEIRAGLCVPTVRRRLPSSGSRSGVGGSRSTSSRG